MNQKNNRKLIYFVLLAFFLLGIILSVIISYSQKNDLNVVFLDVGQGDSILISEGDQQLLIDGGKDGKILLEKLGKYVPFWDRKIETIIETHPDADHIGGLIDVLGAYNVDSVIETKMQNDSQTFKKLESLIVENKINKINKIEAKHHLKIKFNSGAVAEIIYPFESVVDISSKDTNKYSVVVKLTSGSNKFLFTGDLPTEQENELLAKNIDVGAQFLKIAHHGSKYASGNQFLATVKPLDAIISVGKNNSYGHPNQEVLQRLTAGKINIFRTDEIGDIVYRCLAAESKCQKVESF